MTSGEKPLRCRLLLRPGAVTWGQGHHFLLQLTTWTRHPRRSVLYFRFMFFKIILLFYNKSLLKPFSTESYGEDRSMTETDINSTAFPMIELCRYGERRPTIYIAISRSQAHSHGNARVSSYSNPFQSRSPPVPSSMQHRSID